MGYIPILRILGAWYTPIPPHVAGTPLTQPTPATRTLLYPIFSGRATLVAHVHGTLQAFFDGAGRLQNIARHVLFPKIPLWGLADNTDAGAPADAAKVTISAPLHAIVCSATRARDQFGITWSRINGIIHKAGITCPDGTADTASPLGLRNALGATGIVYPGRTDTAAEFGTARLPRIRMARINAGAAWARCSWVRPHDLFAQLPVAGLLDQFFRA